MILCVIDQPIVGKDDALRAPFLRSQGIDVTFRIYSPFGFRKQSLVISEPAAADALPRCVRLQRTARLSQLLRFLLCNEIVGQVSV